MSAAALVWAVTAGLLVATAAARGDGHGTASDPGAAPHVAVSIGFAHLSPERVDLATGETARWTNDSARVHTVTADDGSFDSGRMATTQTFSRRFEAVGDAPYHCTLHPSIRGIVTTRDLVLDTPAVAAAPNRPFPLSGRASAVVGAGTSVSIERDAGTGFIPVASTTVSAAATFSARLLAPATGSYRAVAGAATSMPVQLRVLDRRISLRVRHEHRRTVLHTKVSPPAPGGRVVLQLDLPQRFGWWPVRRAKLDADSSASFDLRPKRRLRARVRLTLPDWATPLATSRTVRIGPLRSR